MPVENPDPPIGKEEQGRHKWPEHHGDARAQGHVPRALKDQALPEIGDEFQPYRRTVPPEEGGESRTEQAGMKHIPQTSAHPDLGGIESDDAEKRTEDSQDPAEEAGIEGGVPREEGVPTVKIRPEGAQSCIPGAEGCCFPARIPRLVSSHRPRTGGGIPSIGGPLFAGGCGTTPGIGVMIGRPGSRGRGGTVHRAPRGIGPWARVGWTCRIPCPRTGTRTLPKGDAPAMQDLEAGFLGADPMPKPEKSGMKDRALNGEGNLLAAPDPQDKGGEEDKGKPQEKNGRKDQEYRQKNLHRSPYSAEEFRGPVPG